MNASWSAKAETYLRRLCLDIPTRQVGSEGNRAATGLFADVVAACGFATEAPAFACLDWRQDGVDLAVGEDAFTAHASPYTLGCRVNAPLSAISTVEELAAAELADRVVLLHGEIAKEQLMPKNFPFYNPVEHRRIVGLLEEKRPLAIVAATGRNPLLAGGACPFALLEDGDFDIPSAYVTDVEGLRLAAYAGREAALAIRASRLPASGCNVVARKGNASRRVALLAHIDARRGSPGAIDNAAGVAVLLLLAELLADYRGELGIELVAVNGEDYYAVPGELQYLAANAGKFAEIVLGVNLDGVGYRKGNVAYSLYECPPGIAECIHGTFAGREGMVEGEQWYQGDHGLFVFNQVPALALTSELAAELLAEVVHTTKDTPENVDPVRLAVLAHALRDLLLALERQVK